MSEDRFWKWRMGCAANDINDALDGLVHRGILDRQTSHELSLLIGQHIADLRPRELPPSAPDLKDRIRTRLLGEQLDKVTTRVKVLKQRLGRAIPFPDVKYGSKRKANKLQCEMYELTNRLNGHKGD